MAKWKEFLARTSTLWSLRQSGLLTDWSVTVKDASGSARTYPVHSPVLAHHSEFFRVLFDSGSGSGSGSGWKENTSREVTVTLPGDATADAFPFVLDFCYSDTQHFVAIPERQWVHVAVIAEQLQMTALKAQLLEQLEMVCDRAHPHKIDGTVLGELFLDTLDPELAVSKDLVDVVHSCMVYYVANHKTGFTGVCALNRSRLSDEDVVTAMLRVWGAARGANSVSVAAAVGAYVKEHRHAVVESGRAAEVLTYMDVSADTLSLWLFALQVDAADVVSRCRAFASRKFYKWDAQVWMPLPREQLTALLSSESLCVKSEDSVLDVLLMWLAEHEATAEEASAMLMSCVDFPFVSRERVLAVSRDASSLALVKHILEGRMAVEAQQLTAQPLHALVWEFDKRSAYQATFSSTALSGMCFHAVTAAHQPCGSVRITINAEQNTFVGVIPPAVIAQAKPTALLRPEDKGISLCIANGDIRVLTSHCKKLTMPAKSSTPVEVVVSWNQVSVTFSCGGRVESVEDCCSSRGIFVTRYSTNTYYGEFRNDNVKVNAILSPRSNGNASDDDSASSALSSSRPSTQVVRVGGIRIVLS